MKTIWIGIIPGIFGYGISVAEDSEEKCMKALERGYQAWLDGSESDDYEEQFHEDGTEMTRFEKALEHWGGSVDEVALGKIYNDDFR